MPSTSISIWCIFIITINWNWVKSFFISSNLSSNSVVWSASDITQSSVWSIWKSFYSFSSQVTKVLTALHVKFAWKTETGCVWIGGTTSRKDTFSEIWGDREDATAENIDAAISNIEYKIYIFACIICLRTKYQSLLLSSTSSLNLIHLLVRSTKSISVRELLIKYLFNSIFIRN